MTTRDLTLASEPTKPLAGLRVIDMTRFVSGPYCTMLLADAGADVIKVEPPDGDESRHSRPVYPGRTHANSVGATFLRLNRGKRSIVLDLKVPRNRDRLANLIQSADVLIENFRPGVLERLGFSESRLREINAGLIYCTISGFGHFNTPWRDRPAFNLIAEYEAGLYIQSGAQPAAVGPYIGDIVPGLHALSGVLMALHRKAQTGQGSRVDVAMTDSVLSLNELNASNEMWLGQEWDAGKDVNFCPSGVYQASNGWVCVDVVTQQQWSVLCELIGKPDLAVHPDLQDGRARSRNYEYLIEGPLLDWLATRKAEEAMYDLAGAGVPAAVVRSAGEALASAHATSRAMRTSVSMSDGPPLNVVGTPIKINGIGSVATTAPGLGEHTDEVLAEVGRRAAQTDVRRGDCPG